MVSPLSATRYHRPHPYQDRTNEEQIPRFSPPSNYNSSNYSKTYDNSRRPSNIYPQNSYSAFEYNVDTYGNKNWNEEENYHLDRYFDAASPKIVRTATLNTNNYLGSNPTSTFEKQYSPSEHIDLESFNGNSTYQDSNLSTERNKGSEPSRTRLNKAESSPSCNQIHQQQLNSCTEHQNTTNVKQCQNHVRESQFDYQHKDYEYDSHYGYVKKVHSTKIVSEKDSTTTSKFPKRTNILTCLICSEEVKRRDVLEHLLYGYVQCLSCPWSATNCKDYSERHKNRYQCSHCQLKWVFSTVEQIGKNPESGTKKSLKEYLAVSIALKHYPPYEFAYNYLQSIVDKMPDEQCEDIPALIDSDLEHNKCDYPASDAGIDSSVNINGNVTVICNNSKETANTELQNLEEFVTFNQAPQPHVLQDQSANDELDVELLNSKKIVFDTASKTYAKKEYLESSSSSRMPRKKKNSSKKKTVKDKHKTLIIGAPSDDINESKNSEVTPKKQEKKEYNSEDRDILPSFVSDNYVLTYTLSDDCPQCYATLNPGEFTVCMKSHILVAKCEECSLYICLRSKLIDSYKSLLKKQ